MVIRDIAWWPSLIIAGVFAATLSSALGSMMGAPRILQAFARDEIFSWLKYFGAGSAKTGEPRRATVITFVIAQTCIVFGDLNAIAPIITMFFMITYGLLNVATFYEAITEKSELSPHLSLLPLVSIGSRRGGLYRRIMFLINWIWATVSMLFIAGLVWYIRSRDIESRWGDLQSGVAFEKARRALLRLEEELYHPKNWRPIIMALSGTGWTRPHIPIYGHWLTSGHGVLTLAQVVTGDIETLAEHHKRYEEGLRKFIAKEELQAFLLVSCNEHLSEGIEAILQCYGIGSLRPNTILLGWPRDASKADRIFGANIRLIARMKRSVLVARFLLHRTDERVDESSTEEHWSVPPGSIDIWWRGMKNGELMLLLAHLLHKNPEWRDNPIRVLRVVEKAEAVNEVNNHLVRLGAKAPYHDSD